MEIKAQLQKPYTDDEKIDFVVQQNHRLGYEIVEKSDSLEAWGYTEEELEQQERERIKKLSLTRGDVFIGLIQARMIDEATLKQQLEEQMPETTPEEKKRKMLAINALTNALNFHRGHDLVNEIGDELGLTQESLDLFFETNDYRYLLPAYLFKIVATPSTAKVIINGEEQSEVLLQYRPDGNLVEYEVSAEGYVTQSDSKVVTQSETLNIELIEAI